MNYKIMQRYGFFEVKTSGVFDSSLFSEIFSNLFDREDWVENSMILYDHSDLDVSLLSPDEMVDFISVCEHWRSEAGKGKCAFVTPQDDQFSFACMFRRRALFKWDVDMDVFRSRSLAMSWLFEEECSGYMYAPSPSDLCDAKTV